MSKKDILLGVINGFQVIAPSSSSLLRRIEDKGNGDRDRDSNFDPELLLLTDGTDKNEVTVFLLTGFMSPSSCNVLFFDSQGGINVFVGEHVSTLSFALAL